MEKTVAACQPLWTRERGRARQGVGGEMSCVITQGKDHGSACAGNSGGPAGARVRATQGTGRTTPRAHAAGRAHKKVRARRLHA